MRVGRSLNAYPFLHSVRECAPLERVHMIAATDYRAYVSIRPLYQKVALAHPFPSPWLSPLPPTQLEKKLLASLAEICSRMEVFRLILETW